MKKIVALMTLVLAFTLAACQPSSSFDETKNITVYTRDTTSGTRAGFMEGIGFATASTSDDVLVDGFVIKDNTGILTSIGTDEYGIGYVSLSSLNATIKGLNFEGVAPTVANVLNNTYGLKRPFMWMVRDAGDYESTEIEQLVEAFIAFLGTTDAADIINNEGAIALSTTITWDSIKADYPITARNNANVTLRFGGSDSIQKVAQALTRAFSAKAGNFVAEHDHTGSGDAFKRTQTIGLTDPVSKHVGFASRYFKDTEKVGVDVTDMGQLAWDAIVAIVHKNNPVTNVTAAQLKAIYDGSTTKWSTLITE
ncbi:substrate-binding domain-containing protein [Acholeplasma vituli]|uniref:Substrate-binding domain-containing protein n=1 Tax=Paracholeplasma vituli TaxID=69473 RepID=A0ABT2PUY3_9MOLU|nr:substrate-binding domain-containing protein [Paracholeplasma vituli]MCU0104755.1 substrate-binding domain-containing protein [Paracholeplasma vituli]